jgi:hypothetical protein
MNQLRDEIGGAFEHLTERFEAEGGRRIGAVFLVYVLLATLIAGAASPGAGLALLVLGLLAILYFAFSPHHFHELTAGLPRTGAAAEQQPRAKAAARKTADANAGEKPATRKSPAKPSQEAAAGRA